MPVQNLKENHQKMQSLRTPPKRLHGSATRSLPSFREMQPDGSLYSHAVRPLLVVAAPDLLGRRPGTAPIAQGSIAIEGRFARSLLAAPCGLDSARTAHIALHLRRMLKDPNSCGFLD